MIVGRADGGMVVGAVGAIAGPFRVSFGATPAESVAWKVRLKWLGGDAINRWAAGCEVSLVRDLDRVARCSEGASKKRLRAPMSSGEEASL